MEEEYDFRDARRGAVDSERAGKTRIAVRLDSDILDGLRAQVDAAGGGDYQTLINSALRDHMNAERGRGV